MYSQEANEIVEAARKKLIDDFRIMCSEHNIQDFKDGAAVAIIMHMCSQLEGCLLYTSPSPRDRG